MSLPVLHAAAGYGVYLLSKDRTQKTDKTEWDIAAVCTALAVLPDLDFIPGILAGDSGLYHRAASHSFFAAFAFGAVAAAFLCFRKKRSFIKSFLVASAAYVSHIILDLFGGGAKGLALLWPFTEQRFYGPRMDPAGDMSTCLLDNADSFQGFFTAVMHSAGTFAFELFIVFFFWSLATAMRPPAREYRGREALAFMRCAIAGLLLAATVLIHT